MARSVRRSTLALMPCIAYVTLILATQAAARNIYLNGVDISNAQNQEVLGATVQINEKGDVFILAPHYQVNEEDTYLPLSSAKSALNAATPPKHQKPQELNGKLPDDEKTPEPDAPQDAPRTISQGRNAEAGAELLPASADEPGATSGVAARADSAEQSAPAATRAGALNGTPAQQPSQAIPKDAQKTSN